MNIEFVNHVKFALLALEASFFQVTHVYFVQQNPISTQFACEDFHPMLTGSGYLIIQKTSDLRLTRIKKFASIDSSRFYLAW